MWRWTTPSITVTVVVALARWGFDCEHLAASWHDRVHRDTRVLPLSTLAGAIDSSLVARCLGDDLASQASERGVGLVGHLGMRALRPSKLPRPTNKPIF